MTQLRKDPDSISNWLDRTLGEGKRGSSFMDIDGFFMAHDRDGNRFLFLELKEDGEPISGGQNHALKALARRPGMTVWKVTRRKDGRVCWMDKRTEELEIISEIELRARWLAWWSASADPGGKVAS